MYMQSYRPIPTIKPILMKLYHIMMTLIVIDLVIHTNFFRITVIEQKRHIVYKSHNNTINNIANYNDVVMLCVIFK